MGSFLLNPYISFSSGGGSGVVLNSSSANTNLGVAWDGSSLQYDASEQIAWGNSGKVYSTVIAAPTLYNFFYGASNAPLSGRNGACGGQGDDTVNFYYIDSSTSRIRKYTTSGSDLSSEAIDSNYRVQFDYDHANDISVHAHNSSNTVLVRQNASGTATETEFTLPDLSSIQDLCITGISGSDITIQVLDGTNTYNYTITV